ncbi:MAG: TIGR03943 family protein [Clostridium baratii]|uniref:TIGR03943 family putative permease subunit n=1 Tax=Clostridium baratii TaxID=1561 RepID=UPI0006C71464|nr:TIGR03943 family protein [Clostridium baratii]MBS6006185.1 TIGR03943 family protein [Clostridium baratii]MDU1053258.1 TIGR03943 family protein [Clostridium baratii]MDU4911216.1 TIGR03943 family protein [Clostridium baratii]CUP10397.1 membrane-spanning protein [Clostridium baratii]
MRLNKRELIDLIILFFITSIFYYLIIGDNIEIFLNPRMNKYIIFAFIIFVSLTINQFFNAFTINTFRAVRRGALVFLVLILAFISLIYRNDLKKELVNEEINKEISYEEDNFNEIYKITERLNSENKEDKNTIVLNSDNYTRIFPNIMENPNEFKSKKIKTEGLVYKSKEINNNEFTIAREVMSCCVADVQIVGLMCEYDNSVDLKENEWVSVEGVIDVKDNKPVINVKEVIKLEKPKNSYIYPIQ